jgi:hypothetical protein
VVLFDAPQLGSVDLPVKLNKRHPKPGAKLYDLSGLV